MLEQIFIEYFEKTKTDILFGANDIPDIKAKAEKARGEITEIFKVGYTMILKNCKSTPT